VRATVDTEADIALVRDQLLRMLSLDVDATLWRETLAADPVAAQLSRTFPGLRPACFASPYEAATWAVMSQRVQMRQAAGIRRSICERLGQHAEVDGVPLHAFPDPETLRGADDLGLPQVKVERLHAIAEAALGGRLDAASLRAAGPEHALADLRRLPGIGEFSAELVLIRGAGEPDYFPRTGAPPSRGPRAGLRTRRD
jgi:DNA-3-methyladenine glycosylase II